jgi:RraA family protein
MTLGFCVNERQQAVSQATVDLFKTLAVANISDNMGRLSHGGAKLRPMGVNCRIAGPSVTVKVRPGDNLMVHKGLNMAQRGDVLVVDAGGDVTNSIIGELMLAVAEEKGLGGIVIYGAVRDIVAIAQSSVPVFAVGVTHRGPYKDGPGEVNTVIGIEGMTVAPGDLIVADEDGVLCVPFAHTDAVYAGVQKTMQREANVLAQTRAGTVDRSWVDEALRTRGCSGV